MVFRIIIIFFIFTITVYSQHGVRPGYSYIDDANRQAIITIFNQSDEEKEVEIGLKFGYPTYEDSLGLTLMNYNDPDNEKKFSINSRIKIFPKRVILQPNTQQYVKLILTGNSDDIADGCYWTRISTKSTTKKKQIDIESGENVSVGVDIAYESTTILMYQKGNLTTNLELGDVDIREDSLNYYLLVDTKKLGNSPFIGMFNLKLEHESSGKLDPIIGSYVIYFDEKPGIKLPKNDVKPGNYKAELLVNTKREDIDLERRVNANDIIKTFNFEIR